MPTLTHGDAQDMLDIFKRGWEGRDPDLIMSLFRADAEYRDDPFAEPMTGTNAIRARWNEIAASQLNIEFDAERIWVSGMTVLASWHAAYTRRSNGERVRTRAFTTLELDEERAVHRYRQWPLERVVGIDSTVRPEAEAADGR
jgi:hypothetical protein